MPNDMVFHLGAKIGMAWLHGDIYGIHVTVTTLDTCYVPGELKVGIPPGKVEDPDTEYLTFEFTHKDGPCGQIVSEKAKSIEVPFPKAKKNVKVYVVVNGQVAGEATTYFPKSKP